MDVLLIILIVIGVLVVALAIGGYVAISRRREQEEGSLQARAAEANEHLAQAHAADNGWERTALEAAARRIHAEQHGGAEPSSLHLVQVIDMPGTDDDVAVFHADGQELRLGRRNGEWVAG